MREVKRSLSIRRFLFKVDDAAELFGEARGYLEYIGEIKSSQPDEDGLRVLMEDLYYNN
ncbi:hypothetical protein CASFOL_043008 [Castilleja foliolosa]|uniref:Uncharacterized protein n=1 Tax=Castilleja foliolosa TaxID=1961234 RepID=A0ABD3B7J8_9LAMI